MNVVMRRPTWLLPVALLCCAFLLWTSSLDAPELWGDELYTHVVTAKPLSEMLRLVLIDAVHPPLYYLAVHGWQKLAGSSAFALRMPSVFAMLLGTAILARLARETGVARRGWIALLIALLNPFLYWYAREMRMYAQLFALVAAELLLLVLALKGRRRAWFAQAATTAALLNTHYFGFVALLPPFAFLAAERRWRRRLPAWLLAHMAGGATFLLWLLPWLNREPKYIGAGWIPALRPLDFPLTLRTFFFSGMESWPGWLALGAIGGGMAFAFTFRKSNSSPWRPLLILGWALPWVFTAILSWTVLPIYVDRYLIIVLPPLILWLISGFTALPRRYARITLACFAVAMTAGLAGVAGQRAWQRPQWREALALIRETAHPGDLLLTNSPYTEPARLAYAPALAPFGRLVSRHESLPGQRPANQSCDRGATCWVIWERFRVLIHFPPVIDSASAIASQLALENETAAWLFAHREQCDVSAFTHIEVWRCGD